MEYERPTPIELLSEEIADITEILVDEQMSDKSRKNLTARVKELSEKRDNLTQKNSEQ